MSAAEAGPDAAWAEAERIRARIAPPRFPRREWSITRFGARSGEDAGDAISRAVTACHTAGGGRVRVPAGEFLTGAVRLLSGVEMHLDRGAVLRFVPDPARYPLVLTRFEGVEVINFSPLIYAHGARDIAVTGSGVLDGGADDAHWWPWKGSADFGWRPGAPSQAADRAALFAMAERGVPASERVFGPGHFLRPSFFAPYRCRNVMIEGVTLRNAPMWQITPGLCENVIVRGVTAEARGPNTDGCDPESCRDVLIEGCTFSTGDDCIAIKSGRNADGRRLHTPTENVIIRDCRMAAGHGAVTIGSEITGGVRNVFVERCTFDSPDLHYGLRFKDNALRGGVLENMRFRDIVVRRAAKAAVQVDFEYEEGGAGPYAPVLRDVAITRLRSLDCPQALDLRGLPNGRVEDIRLTDCSFAGLRRPDVVRNVTGLSRERVTETPASA